MAKEFDAQYKLSGIDVMTTQFTPKDYAEDPSLDAPPDSPLPTVKYLILSTQRSGSNFLCHNLSSMGAGIPIEYLNLGRKKDICSRLGATGDDEEYLESLLRRRSPNGVFGMKLQAQQLAENLALVRTHFPLDQTRMILLLRADIVSQAYSLHHAQRTGRWWHTDEVSSRPQEYIPENDTAHIERCSRQLINDEYYLRRYLYASPCERLCLFYENLQEDLEASMKRILSFLGRPNLFNPSKLTSFAAPSARQAPPAK